MTPSDHITQPDPLIGAVLEGKYRLDALLGRGGFGAVYRGYHTQLERRIAVKVMKEATAADRRAVERFKREALAVARLKHPNIVAVYDFGVAPEAGVFLVMEYIDGRSLREELRLRGRIPISPSVELVRQVCSAIHVAHSAGVIHRDLKPENLFLETAADGSLIIKILDFGIAKLRFGDEQSDSDGQRRALTIEGALLGTPLYMSPEQCEGGPVDERSDVYALGCVLFEMVTGRPPFTAASIAAVVCKHLLEPPPTAGDVVSEVPRELDAVLLRALAKDPADRFQSALDLARALAKTPHVPDDGSFPRVLVYKTDDATVGSARGAATREAPVWEGQSTERIVPNNLPQEMTSFIGREREISEVRRLLGASRLVTLTGAGGIGKTRLALRVAHETVAAYPDGVWMVELGSITDPALVVRAAAEALEVREDVITPRLDTLLLALEGKRALLVLDNCEQVVDGCADLAVALQRSTSQVRVLATSRQALGVPGEVIWSVPALGLPVVDTSDFPGELLSVESVHLFVERARLCRPDFDLTASNAARVAGICRQLDGLPLAIELAAARTKILSVEQIAVRLKDRFRLLTHGPGTSPRQQTLRATIDWSYGLLTELEQALLDRLSVFVGGFTIEAAEAVCGGNDECRMRNDELEIELRGERSTSDIHHSSFIIHHSEVLDLLANLVDKSLVTVAHGGAAARYRLLESIREYAAERLGEADDLLRRHRDYFLAFAEDARSKLEGKDGRLWGDYLQADFDNFRAALEWSSREEGDGVPFLRLATALWVFCYQRGYLSEGRSWLETALDRAGDRAPAALRAAAFTGAGNLASDQSDIRAARAFHERSLDIHRELGDKRGIASALHNLGIINLLLGDFRPAETLFAESYALCREIGDDRRCALSLLNQTTVAMELGRWDTVDADMAESLRIFREHGYEYGVSHALVLHAQAALARGDVEGLDRYTDEALDVARRIDGKHNIAFGLYLKGSAALLVGQTARAEGLLVDALGQFRDLGDKECSAVVLGALARSARSSGDLARAAAHARGSLDLQWRIGAKKGLAECFEEAAAIAVARGAAALAAELFGAASALRGRIGSTIPPVDRADREQISARISEALGVEAFERLCAAGAALSLDEVAARAREALGESVATDRG